MGGVQSEDMGGVGSKKRKSSEAKVNHFKNHLHLLFGDLSGLHWVILETLIIVCALEIKVCDT